MLLDARPVAASRLHAAGLINRLSVDGTEALVWAEQLSLVLAATPLAFEQSKALIADATRTTLAESFAAERHRLLNKRPRAI